jgi:hypothetical protein
MRRIQLQKQPYRHSSQDKYYENAPEVITDTERFMKAQQMALDLLALIDSTIETDDTELQSEPALPAESKH